MTFLDGWIEQHKTFDLKNQASFVINIGLRSKVSNPRQRGKTLTLPHAKLLLNPNTDVVGL